MRDYRPITINRRAKYDYGIEERLIAGIALEGAEVKSVRNGRADLKGAFATLNEKGLWLNNATIAPFQPGQAKPDYDPTRSRKLLVHKKELKDLALRRRAGKSIVPLSIGVQGRFIKAELGIGRGKKRRDKRESIKRRMAGREAARAIKGK